MFAFRYPMADRYLYFVLPGLLGAALVTLAPRLDAGWALLRRRGVRAVPGLLALAVGTLALGIGFGVRAHERAAVFRSGERFERDAALHYPDGLSGQLARGRVALGRGDVAGTLDALDAAHRQGYRNALLMMRDPYFGQLRGEPRFTALAQDMAREWIAQFDTLPRQIPDALVDLFQYQLLLGENEAALATLARLEGMPEQVDPKLVQQLRHQAEQMIERQEHAS